MLAEMWAVPISSDPSIDLIYVQDRTMRGVHFTRWSRTRKQKTSNSTLFQHWKQIIARFKHHLPSLRHYRITEYKFQVNVSAIPDGRPKYETVFS